MRILSFSLKITLLALIPFLAMTSCKDDPIVPDTATIKGTVTIDNAALWSTWKDSGVVELVIFPAFSLNPPAGWGDIADNILGPGVPGGRFAIGAPFNAQNPIVVTYSPGISGFTYELEVDPGTYSALALGFRHNRVTDPSRKTATLGVYWNNPAVVSHGIVIRTAIGAPPIFDEPAPAVITLNKGDNVTLDFKADFAFVQQWFQ